MRWLIVEDALRDRKGHWFEYLGTFARELRRLGDDVTILADRAAEPFLIEQLSVQPVLPASIWHRMSDGAGALKRYLRVPGHAWQTYRTLKKYFRKRRPFEVIFVPTMLVHHLLGWIWLIKRVLKGMPGKVILFFPNTPVYYPAGSNEPAWHPAPTARLFCRLIRSLGVEVAQGRVILGAETLPMCMALTRLTGVPFTYFPHPVAADENIETLKIEKQRSAKEAEGAAAGGLPSSHIVFGSYGSARDEKGSDTLVAAVAEYCRRHPDSRARFVLQCVEGDAAKWRMLQGNPRVQLINRYFADGEYGRQLQATDVMLLPYRHSSYGLRVSRVVIEAMIHRLPVVATRGTTLAQQAEQFGAVVLCEDGDVASLVSAMETMERDYETLAGQACQRQHLAQEHFSVGNFRKLLDSNPSGMAAQK